MNGNGDMDQHRRRWALGYGIFLAILTALPYAIAFASENADWVFTGFLFGVDDGNSYIAKMLAGASGDWTFRTPYSTLPQGGLLFIYAYFLLMGKLAAPPELHLQLLLIFQVFRFAAVVLISMATYDFIAYFEPRESFRRFGTVLATLGGGLGWLLTALGAGSLFGSLPLDFYSPETFGFLSILGVPHLAVGRALLLWGILALVNPGQGNRYRTHAGFRSGLLWLAAGIFNPIAPAVGWLVVGLWLVLTGMRGRISTWWGRFKPLTIAAGISSPVVLYTLIGSMVEPFFREWAAQNRILSPHPLHYLFAFAIYLPWILIGARRILAERSPGKMLPLLWVGLIPVLAYLPLGLQRRLPEAAFTAIAVLVVWGMGQRHEETPVAPRQWMWLVPAFLSSLFLLTGGLSAAGSRSEPVFRPAAEVQALDFLVAHAERDAVVLATKDIGNVVPAFAPVRVVIGHGPETVHFDEILLRVNAYFSGELSGEEQYTLFQDFDVSYVFGRSEDTPAPSGWLRVYDEGGYVIFTEK